MSPYASYRTLGAYISPLGGMHKAFKVIRNHSIDYATKLQASTLWKEAALWSYLLYLLPKVTFPLMAMSLSEPNVARSSHPNFILIEILLKALSKGQFYMVA
jgi:hypothetical protein